MNEINSMIPIVAKTAVGVSEQISGFIARTKAAGFIQRAKFEQLKDQTNKILAEMKGYNLADLTITNLEQIVRTQELIDYYVQQGVLHGAALDMAMGQLEELNNSLRRNLQMYGKGEWR